MKLPTRMLDLSSPLDNDTVFDPPFMRPKIEYRTNAENAPMLLNNFPGLRQEDLPDGEGWAFEIVQLTTHNGTHMDAPVQYQSKSIDGNRMLAIDRDSTRLVLPSRRQARFSAFARRACGYCP